MIANKELSVYLLEATFEAEKALLKSPTIVSEKNGKDLVTSWDLSIQAALLDYFERQRIKVSFLGEEGTYLDECPEIVLLVDEMEGSQNAINALPFGINIAAAPYGPHLKVQDLVASVVANLRDGRKFVAIKGEGFGTIEGNTSVRNPFKKSTDIWEVPLGYITSPQQLKKQFDVYNLFSSLFGPQYRSVDSTGTRLVEITSANIRAYADYRDATKPWDVLPSWLILKEGGFICTDILGFHFEEASLCIEGKLNMNVGKNFLATLSKDDHKKVTDGLIKMRLLRAFLDDIESSWSLSEKWRQITINILPTFFLDPIRSANNILKGLTDKTPELVGHYVAELFTEIIRDKKESYGFIEEADLSSFKNTVESFLCSLSPDERLNRGFEDNIKRPFN
ncbi:MAG: hypothetical protein PHW72_00080 [Candidatus Pacebacteria bacterium]|nr:hypothetical protein [Candidatus Paceibacterota bacterium]